MLAAGLLLARPCQQVLARLVELACDLLNAASSAIWELEGEVLKLSASSGSHQHEAALPLRESLAGQAILSRSLLVADDVRTDPRFRRPDLAQTQDWTRALVIPLLTSEEHQPGPGHLSRHIGRRVGQHHQPIDGLQFQGRHRPGQFLYVEHIDGAVGQVPPQLSQRVSVANLPGGHHDPRTR